MDKKNLLIDSTSDKKITQEPFRQLFESESMLYHTLELRRLTA